MSEKTEETIAIESKRFWSRRNVIGAMAAAASAAALVGHATAATATATDFPEFENTGKKFRVGVPMNYGPQNQPWRRGIWQVAKVIEEAGGEVVALRGVPSKESEQDAFRQLMDRGIDVLVLGSLSNESETSYIVDEARSRNIKTVGFAVYAKQSPNVVEDAFATSLLLGNWLADRFQREGVFAQTANNRGYYAGFDMQTDMLALMMTYQTRMKMLPFLPGGTGTEDEISKARENTIALLQSNPDPASITAISSWWWPLTLGTVQALRQMDRKLVVTNHNFHDQLLSEMARPDSPIEFTTSPPFDILGERVGKLAVALGQGHDVPNETFFIPVDTATKETAEARRVELLEKDNQAVEFLKKFGG
nr:substrate-binding domain-containing protein [uncultured Devosia sp.]